MKKLTPNREFVLRHLFSIVVFLGLGGWFAADAFVRYPATPARDLYASIEKREPAEDTDAATLEAFKRQKISTQKLLALLTLSAGVAASLHLAFAASARFAFDTGGFILRGQRHSWEEVRSADFSRWESKRVAVLRGDGWKFTLDAWHHDGAAEAREAYLAAANAGGETHGGTEKGGAA